MKTMMNFNLNLIRWSIAAAVVMTNCSSKDHASDTPDAKAAESQADTAKASVSADGLVIRLSKLQAAKFETQKVETEKTEISLQASARTVASLVSSADLAKPLVVFETADESQLYSDYTTAKAAYDRSAKQLPRIKDLFASNAASGKDLLDAETDFAESEAALRSAESKLLQNGLSPKQLAGMRAGSVFIMADVPESKISAVSVGESVVLEFNSFMGEKFTGKVVSIGDVVDAATRTIHAGIELANSKGRIKPGMFAKASLNESVIEAASVMPAAVVSVDTKTFVFVKTGEGVIERRQVELGAAVGKNLQVLSGLKKGEDVVVTNAILLKGMSFGY
jgi:cobalt-zinc-cadmium efflux system membrane fusion protein